MLGKIKENFAIINADDFYGFDAYKTISWFLQNNKDENKYAMVGYKAINTLTKNGSVKRGICDIKDDKLPVSNHSMVLSGGNSITKDVCIILIAQEILKILRAVDKDQIYVRQIYLSHIYSVI